MMDLCSGAIRFPVQHADTVTALGCSVGFVFITYGGLISGVAGHLRIAIFFQSGFVFHWNTIGLPDASNDNYLIE